ncbi:oligosaccharide flippase family protein [Vibrio breoganii]
MNYNLKIKVLNAVNKYKDALNNLGYLTFLQMVNMLFPFLLYPILINLLGIETYGFVIYATGVALFISVFISYGYNLSATKLIAENITNKENVSKVFSTTLVAKTCLFLLCVLVYLLLIVTLVEKENRFYYYYSIGSLIMEVLCPVWLFQGLNRLKPFVVINLFSKTLMLIFVIVFVSDVSDIELFLVINFLTSIITGILSICAAIRYFDVKYSRVSIDDLVDSFKNGWPIFLSTLLTSIKDRSSIIIVGTWIGKEYVVIYDIMSKSLGFLSMPQNIIQTAFFPTICKNKNLLEIKKTISVILFVNMALVILSIPFAGFFLEQYFGVNDLLTYVLISSTAIFIGVSSSIARFIYIPFHLNEIFLKTLIANLSIFVLLNIILFGVYSPDSLRPYALILFICSVCEAIIRLVSVKKKF